MAHALVFGASGISGHALVTQALSYPNTNTFAHVTGLTNRPLSIADAGFPDDPRLQLVSGIDLTTDVDTVVQKLKSEVKNVETVSHVFFTAYIEKADFQDAKAVNTSILRVAVQALEQTSPALKVIILQTGGKGCGVEFSDKISIKAPLREDYPRIPKPYSDNVFYYPQYDLLKEMSAHSPWTFTEVRPDVIVGFVPGTNFMNAAQGLGLYLSLYAAVHGAGAEVVFPGTEGSWTCKHTDTSQDVLARFEIFAALNREQGKCGNGSSFNIADGEVVTWAGKWGPICEYFGLVGVGPKERTGEAEGEAGGSVAVADFAKENMGTWAEVVKEHGLKEGRMEGYSWGFLDFVMRVFDFDRQYDLSRARGVGFDEEVDTVEGYRMAFERMRAAKVIP